MDQKSVQNFLQFVSVDMKTEFEFVARLTCILGCFGGWHSSRVPFVLFSFVQDNHELPKKISHTVS